MGKRLAVLISGTGSNLQALLDHADLGGTVELVASDRSGAAGLARARAAGVDTAVVELADYRERDDWDAALYERVAAAKPDLLVLAGFMRVLSPRFVRRWPMINTHPALLPAFPGARPVPDALGYGVKVTGATVHFAVEEFDAGPIIAQEAVPVAEDDTVDSLHGRIKQVEHRLLCEAVALACRDRLRVEGRHVRIKP